MQKQLIIINGQPLGKFKASWLLLKETWKYLRADKEIIWIPFITAAITVFAFGILLTLFVVAVLAGDLPTSTEGQPMTPVEWLFLFLVYIMCAFTLALSQGGIAHTVSVRAHGGNASLGEALRAAFSRWRDLLIWAIITSTVGIALRAIFERSQLLGKIVSGLIGAAWSVLTYFTVPAMILDKKSAISAIRHSGAVFKRTWGETIISNVTLGLAFFVINLGVIMSVFLLGLIAFFLHVSIVLVLIVGILLIVLFIVCSALIQASLEAILKVLLYMYANEKTLPQNFNQELLTQVLSSPTAEQTSNVGVPTTTITT
jgi:hypothetical protein